MRHHVFTLIGCSLASLTLAIGSVPGQARANGRQTAVLTAHVKSGDNGQCRFEAAVDPLQFVVMLGGKYHVLRVTIDNRFGAAGLALSQTADKAQVEFVGAKIDAILDLAGEDAALWDTLPMAVRKLLRFPAQVELREQDSILLFLPAAKVAALEDRRPILIRLTLAGSGMGKVELRAELAKK